MDGRKIVFRFPTSHASARQTASSADGPTGNSEHSSTLASQSLKTTAAGKHPREVSAADQQLHSQGHTSDIIICLKRLREAPPVPSVSESDAFSMEDLTEAGQLQLKAIPERFQTREGREGQLGAVYGLISETRSTPSTPLHKMKSLDKTPKQEGDEKGRHDEFDETLDSLLTLAVDLKQMTDSFLPERDSVRMEKKLQEYLTVLRRLDDMTKNSPAAESDHGKKEQQEMPTEVWKAIDAGMHPDLHLLEQSEALLTQAQHNIHDAKIVEKFLEIGNKLPKHSE